ncbi:MAG TPA: WYL domain-containing protein [Actinomycetota bacterium]
MSEVSKTERLIDLLLLLLDTRRPLSAAEIRAKNPGYAGRTDEAFHRMFERDKAELREIGFAIDHEDLGDGVGYRIIAREALIGDLGLSADEQAALSLAAQAWARGRDPEDGALASLKLTAAGVGGPGAGPWMLPSLDLGEDVRRVLDAIERRKRITFRYRTGGGGEPTERLVEPHGLTFRGGWYVGGLDVAKGERRSYRLSRVDGGIAVGAGSDPDFDVPADAPGEPRAPWEAEGGSRARVAFAPDLAWQVERRRDAARVEERSDGWVVLEIPVADARSFGSWVAGFGRMAVVLEPEEVRRATAAHLSAIVRAGL